MRNDLIVSLEILNHTNDPKN